jgi:hypothetical protein
MVKSMEFNKKSQHEEWKRAGKIRHISDETVVKAAMENAILGEQNR